MEKKYFNVCKAGEKKYNKFRDRNVIGCILAGVLGSSRFNSFLYCDFFGMKALIVGWVGCWIVDTFYVYIAKIITYIGALVKYIVCTNVNVLVSFFFKLVTRQFYTEMC